MVGAKGFGQEAAPRGCVDACGAHGARRAAPGEPCDRGAPGHEWVKCQALDGGVSRVPRVAASLSARGTARRRLSVLRRARSLVRRRILPSSTLPPAEPHGADRGHHVGDAVGPRLGARGVLLAGARRRRVPAEPARAGPGVRAGARRPGLRAVAGARASTRASVVVLRLDGRAHVVRGSQPCPPGAAGHAGRRDAGRPARPAAHAGRGAGAAAGLAGRDGAALGVRRLVLRRLPGRQPLHRRQPPRGGAGRRLGQGRGGGYSGPDALRRVRRPARGDGAARLPARRQPVPAAPALGRGVRHRRPPRPRLHHGPLPASPGQVTRRPRTSRPARGAGRSRAEATARCSGSWTA